VHELRPFPEDVDVHACVEPEASQSLGQRLCGDPVERERNGIKGGRNQGCAGPGCLERGGESRPARALAVEADRQPARLPEALHELPRLGGVERTCGVMEKDSRGAKLLETMRPLEQNVRFTCEARTVHEPYGKLFLRRPDCFGGLAQVGKVVQRIVEAKDIDAAGRGALDESTDEIARERSRTDEEAAAQRDSQRSRAASADGADSLPWALDSTPHGGVEAATAGDFEIRKAGLVEHLRQVEDTRPGSAGSKRFLREEPDGGVDERGHRLG